MRSLLVEDDEMLGPALRLGLRQMGYVVDWVQTGADAQVALRTHRYDAVMLDLGLPDIPGETVLRSIRAHDDGVCVLVMTARYSIRDRVDLLNIGADDYMVKPVDLDELDARLRAVMRRASAGQNQDGEDLGALKLYPSRLAASWHDQAVELTLKEFRLLEVFVRRRHQILTRGELEEALYGWGEEVGSNAVEVHVHYLRKKFSPRLIQTIRGAGYQLCLEELRP